MAVNSKIKTLATKEQLYLLKEDLQKTKADLIKWIFIFWIGAVGVYIRHVSVIFKIILGISCKVLCRQLAYATGYF